MTVAVVIALLFAGITGWLALSGIAPDAINATVGTLAALAVWGLAALIERRWLR